MSNKYLNPLIGITVGSTVNGNNFKPSILQASITKMVAQKEVEMSMSGQSQYVYTDSLNQGTFGVSGSHGVKGVSKFTMALSGYVSNANATESKSISVDYNISMLSGIEYIDFDNLTSEEIINSLSKGPKTLALDVLKKFIDARDYSRGSSIQKDEKMKAWLKSLQDFIAAYGDGIVVGVIWGGIGSVTTTMTSTKQEDNWKYGESTEFTYSTIGNTVAIGETYEGSQKKQNSDVRISCGSQASGACVEKQVNDWFNVVANKSFSEVYDIKLLDKAPTQSSVSAPPKIPDFITEDDKEVKDKLKELGDLKDSKLFSVYQGYEEAKKDNTELTLEEFLINLERKNNVSGIDQVISEVNDNSLDVLSNGGVLPSRFKNKLQQINVTSTYSSSVSDYVPLGIWIINWSDIFPWMSMGFMNDVDSSESQMADYILKVRCMIQDLSTLNTIYNTFVASNINLDFCQLKSASQVADSFKSAQIKLCNNLEKEDAIKIAFDSLSQDAKSIYKHWNENSFLRNAELGFGIMIGDHSPSNHIIDNPTFPHPEAIYESSYCSYNQNNYSAFRSFVKAFPFIDTNGDIYAFGPSSMLLRKVYSDRTIFTKKGSIAMKLTPDKAKGILSNEDAQLIPIPYSAAEGMSWFGQGMGKSISSFSSLTDQLHKLRDELSRLNMCTLSSDSWPENWTYESPYHLRKLKSSYIGIVEEIKTIFG
ncbi:hypothetical protein [Vibrio sp. 11986-1-5]|uniref:hypothetical protein n=1 Tax=Vibrio sp. 11986-1-5 TaxID=2211215 RepID=UPI000D7260F9|nr:hypothetical protein [Vibrio sp. 11986-1-5]PXA69751.1 hypothetical protein DMC15_15215 [Vibrio sp. 11986-1-5]